MDQAPHESPAEGDGAARATLGERTRHALDVLEAIAAPGSELSMKYASAIRSTCRTIATGLGRTRPMLALTGASAAAGLLDAVAGTEIFGGSQELEVGPLIVLSHAETPDFRARFADGRTEMADRLLREGEVVAPPPVPVVVVKKTLETRARETWRWVVSRFRSFMRWARRVPSPPPLPVLVKELPREHERFKEEVRSLVDAHRRGADVVEISIAWPSERLRELTIVDLRGVLRSPDGLEGALASASEADACLLVATEPWRPLRELARRLAALRPHLLVTRVHRRSASNAESALHVALGLDAGRVFDLGELPMTPALGQIIDDERVLNASVRALAALRLADKACTELLETVERELAAELDALERRVRSDVAGAIADLRDFAARSTLGRAARVVEWTVGVLPGIVARIEATRQERVAQATTKKELEAALAFDEAHVEAIRSELRAAVRGPLAHAAEEVGAVWWHHASRLVGTLEDQFGEDLVTGVDTIRADLGEIAPLEARESLDRASKHHQLRWADSWLSSLARVRERCHADIAGQMKKLERDARAEILDAEPVVRSALAQSLEARAKALAGRLDVWATECVNRGREEKEAGLAPRQRRWERVVEDARATAAEIGELNARVSARARTLCSMAR